MKFFILSFFLTFTSSLFGQSVSGYITDMESEEPLFGCTIQISKNNQLVSGAVTDLNGYFSINIDSLDTYVISIDYLGYFSLQEEIAIQKNEPYIRNFKLSVKSAIAAYPIIKSKVLRQPNNLLLTKSFFTRIPGAFNDPSRLLIRFPAISIANDGANQITVKGLPPHLAKWTINNAFIINPNHLSNAGTLTDQASSTGGGVNMISGNSIQSFQFMTTPLNSQFYNAASGISNSNLRIPTGLRYSIGLLGTEASYAKDLPNETYIGINYRYSTLGILSALGVDLSDEEIQFQDLHISFSKKWRNHQLAYNFLFGNNKNYHADKGAESINYKDAQDILFKSNQLISSINYQFIKNKNIFKSTFNISSRESKRSFIVSSFFPELFKSGATNFTERVFSLTNQYHFLINKDFTFELNNSINFENYSDLNELLISNNSNYFSLGLIYKNNNNLVNASAGISTFHRYHVLPEIRISEQITLNQKSSVRLNLSRQGHSITPQISYLLEEVNPFTSLNISLDYFVNTSNNYFQVGLFYHNYRNLLYPENTRISYFDRIDLFQQAIADGYIINNNGKANSYGLMAQCEFLKIQKWQFILGGSLYDMRVFTTELIETSYDFSYTASASASYTVQFNNNKKLILGTALVSRGSEFLSPLDIERSEQAQTNLFSLDLEKIKNNIPYFRTDLKIDYLFGKNQKNTLSLDIQNVLNTQNFGYNYFDPLLETVQVQNQLGLIPILKYTSKI